MIIEESKLKKGGLPRNKIICGNALTVLKKLPDNSIDCIITFPPYYGMRVYEGAEAIWNGDPECKHKWVDWPAGLLHENRNFLRGSQEEVAGKRAVTWIRGFNSVIAKRCAKCNAWFGQLGLELRLEMYIDYLLQITAELKRVLKQTGVMFWVHGDCYGGFQGKYAGYPDQKLKQCETIPRFCKLKKYRKCLLLTPYRLALRMVEEQGWILRNVIIWHKPNHLPSPVKDRFTNAYEPISMLVKSNKPVFYYNVKTRVMADKKPPREEQREGIDYGWKEVDYPEGKTKIPLKIAEIVSSPRARYHRKSKQTRISYWHGVHYWFDLNAVRVPFSNSTLQRINYNYNSSKEGYYAGLSSVNQQKFAKKILSGEVKGKNPGDVWSVSTQPFHGEHFAVFPEKLVEIMIKAACPLQVCRKCKKPRIRTENGLTNCCNAGWRRGIVFDPFAGSGTTGLVAKRPGRDFILIEISKMYCEITAERINKGSVKS